MRFLDDHTLELDGGDRIEPKRIVVATGSRTSCPAEFAGLGDRVVVNDDLFDWEDLPESCAVLGSGVIGLELGQALSPGSGGLSAERVRLIPWASTC